LDRFNPSLHGPFGTTMDEETIPTFEYIIKKLNDYNLAYIHLSEPFTDVSALPYAVTEIAKHFRPLYNGTLMINSGFDQRKGNKVIEEGYADLVAYGKPYISNPDLVERFEHNLAQKLIKIRSTQGKKDIPIIQTLLNKEFELNLRFV
jgi:N-ethylmaleimide reductase